MSKKTAASRKRVVQMTPWGETDYDALEKALDKQASRALVKELASLWDEEEEKAPVGPVAQVAPVVPGVPVEAYGGFKCASHKAPKP